jgi:hypothetical protein
MKAKLPSEYQIAARNHPPDQASDEAYKQKGEACENDVATARNAMDCPSEKGDSNDR